MVTVSIIIAVGGYSKNLKECVSKCGELIGSDYEIIVLPDAEQLPDIKARVIPTGNITPPFKRDIGAKHAKGEILAFLDDDAYPSKEWLSQALKIFKEDESIGCVCGPAVTPQSDSLRQKASGLIYSSLFVSGNHSFRYIPKARREVSDFPSCNFLIRKNLFEEVGGFDKPYWPGEDTFLCLKVLGTGKRMIYSPEVLVYHHRREVFIPHLRQIKNYALHRGYFAKKYPKTSLRLEYFAPSFLVLVFVAAFLFKPALVLIAGYLMVVALSTFNPKLKLFGFTFLGTVLTHLAYGVYFIKGLLAAKMPEES